MWPAAGASPDAGGGSPHQLGEFDVQGVGDEEEVDEAGSTVCVLPSDDRLAVAADLLGELFLSEAGVSASGPDAGPDLLLAGVDPVR
jgi:hypothetical protein